VADFLWTPCIFCRLCVEFIRIHRSSYC